MSRTVSLRWIASRTGPVTEREVHQIEQWLEADWESHDVDRDAVRLIRRLVGTLHARTVECRIFQNLLRSK